MKTNRHIGDCKRLRSKLKLTDAQWQCVGGSCGFYDCKCPDKRAAIAKAHVACEEAQTLRMRRAFEKKADKARVFERFD